MSDWTCTHCGRRECRVYGGIECTKAREAMFEQYLKMLERYAQNQQNAAMGGTSEEK